VEAFFSNERPLFAMKERQYEISQPTNLKQLNGLTNYETASSQESVSVSVKSAFQATNQPTQSGFGAQRSTTITPTTSDRFNRKMEAYKAPEFSKAKPMENHLPQATRDQIEQHILPFFINRSNDPWKRENLTNFFKENNVDPNLLKEVLRSIPKSPENREIVREINRIRTNSSNY
jgi:hypothetical protein